MTDYTSTNTGAEVDAAVDAVEALTGAGYTGNLIVSGTLKSIGSGGLTVTSGDAVFFGNATGGAVIRGYGSTNDINIQNRSNQTALRVPTGTTNVVMDTGDLIITTPTTPASASATGTVGTIAWDTSYIYICVATNTWKRVAIATW